MAEVLKPSINDPRYLQALVNRRTRDRQRAETMGFTFGPIDVDMHSQLGIAIRGDFTCVCGRLEAYRFVRCPRDVQDIRPGFLEVTLERLFDPALALREIGAFSRAHLLDDGYTVAQVDAIIAAGEAFDRGEVRHA